MSEQETPTDTPEEPTQADEAVDQPTLDRFVERLSDELARKDRIERERAAAIVVDGRWVDRLADIVGVLPVVVLVASAMCGYVLARYRFFGRNIIYGVVLATLFVPIATVIIPQFQLVKTLGLLNTRVGVILALSGGGALYVLLFTSFFSTIPEEIFDSAKIDGANFFRMFWLVLPLARPIIGTVVIFQFMQTWNEFNIPLVFTLSKPELRNLAVGMYAFQGEHSMDWTGFAAGTVISIIPVLLVFFLFQGYFVRGLQGAVKQ